MPAVPFVLAVALATVPLAGGPVPATVPVECEITDATLTWGFKESFRAYIDGEIANGEWTTDGDASYTTPAFTWSGGTGTYTPLFGEAQIAFTGSVRFTGHDGLLDTTIANPVLLVQDDSSLLLLDVSGVTMGGDTVDQTAVPFVSLPAAELVGDDAVRTVEAETQLTADGEVAFPNYQAGEAFDPVAVSVTVGTQCPASDVGDVVDTPDDGNPALMWPLAGGIALAIVAGAGIFVATRRRRA